MVKVHPVPEGEAIFEGAEILINGQTVSASCCRVSAIPFNRFWPGHQRSLDQTEIAAFVSMDMDEIGERANITVKSKKNVEEVWLRPLSRDIYVSRGLSCSNNNCLGEVSFTLTARGQYVLEMNDHHCPIMFFVNPMKRTDRVSDDDRVIRFGPGVHHPGKITLQSGQTVVVEPGAVVYTSIFAEKARDIRITGGGIIDNSEYPRVSGSIMTDSPVVLYHCENVEISGVTFRDSACFTVMGFNLSNVIIENIKIVGNWRYNSDGIDLYNSRNVIVRDCFVRTYDDSIVIKAQKPFDGMNCENWLVERCVVWCDWGHALEIGAETRADEYRNILFADCDIIHSHGAALDVQNNGDALCHDIVFDNIRVEYKKSVTPAQMQDADDSPYEYGDRIAMPDLMCAVIPEGYCHPFLCGNTPYGRNRHIVFRNIQAFVPDGMPMPVPPSYFAGHSETEDTRDVEIQGLYVNGRRVADREEANLRIGPFASDIRFE